MPEWLPTFFLAAIALTTALGAIIPYVAVDAPPVDDGGTKTLLIVLPLLIGAANLAMMRYYVLRRARDYPFSRLTAAVQGYAMADGVATYGLVVAILLAEGLWALPFGALAAYGWLSIWLYLRDLPEPPPSAPRERHGLRRDAPQNEGDWNTN